MLYLHRIDDYYAIAGYVALGVQPDRVNRIWRAVIYASDMENTEAKIINSLSFFIMMFFQQSALLTLMKTGLKQFQHRANLFTNITSLGKTKRLELITQAK